MKPTWPLVLSAAAFFHCGSTVWGTDTPPSHGQTSPDAGTRVVRQQAATVPDGGALVDSLSALRSLADWQSLAASPERETMAHTELVKVVIDLEDQGTIYFLQTRQWEIHYYFIQRFLSRPGHPVPDAMSFWRREYLSQDRRFIQGTLVHHLDGDHWVFELVAQDVLDLERTVQAFHRVREAFFLPERLRYRPVPSHHVSATEQLRTLVPILTTDELFAGLQYQPVHPGVAYGYLRFLPDSFRSTDVHPTDIVVLEHTPLELPVCAAAITAELQTPLSHLAVLAQNRDTPDMALRNALTESRLRGFENQLVKLRVGPQDWSLESATQSQAEAAWNSRRPSRSQRPARALRETRLLGLETLRRTDVSRVGAKAAQLGELSQVRPSVRTPRGFAVPFSAYVNHLQRNGLDTVLQHLLQDPAVQQDPAQRETQLAALRTQIEESPVDPVLLQHVRSAIQARFPTSRVRFRSSTNAEDLEGFNGAGLYLSAVTSAAPNDEAIARSLRRVWASTWNFVAYEERSFYRIDQDAVAMGILVQESIDDEQVTGVAITGNPFDEGRPGYYINAQNRGGSVTGAEHGELPEQTLFYTFPSPGSVERLGRSSRDATGPLLSDAEIFSLSGALQAIQTHFYGPSVTAVPTVMDVEFLLSGPRRELVIVQARPYEIRWNEGQTWARPPSP